MSEIDDAKEFTEAADSFKGSENSRSVKALKGEVATKKEEEKMPGRMCQFAFYRDGFVPTTKTVKTLPPGSYEIVADSNAIYCSVVPEPTGLLLKLPEMRSQEVIDIVEKFWKSEKDYKEGNEFVIGGAAYKAGIMIFGPPGTGKSCTIKLLCKDLIARGGTVFYSSNHPHVTMSFLMNFTEIEKNRKCIVILEDIDSLIENYGESGYLEMLDSAKSIDNVLFIATTNYPEKLDPRIYNRPGRFSHVIKIGKPGRSAREAYLKAILKNHRDVDEIVANSDGFTIDHLTALVNAVYREKKELRDEIERLRVLFRVPKSDNDDNKIGIK